MNKSVTNYRRVVIVDPQLKNTKGHNYRYICGIEAELNLPTVVLSHTSFLDTGKSNLEIQPVFTFDQYNNSIFKESYKAGVIDRLFAYHKKISARLTYKNGIWEQDSPLGVTVSFLLKLFSIFMFIPALAVQIKDLIWGKGSSGHVDTTALELKQAFASVNLGKGDLLIFQTMMWPTFESLLELRLHTDSIYECDALFIVHEDWLIYNTGFLRFTPAAFEKRVLQNLPFSKAKVLSTNQALSDYCNEWSGYYPEVVKEIEFPDACSNFQVQKKNERKRILIPGIYRGDKNFESVPGLITSICEQRHNIEFCLHKSVMSQVALSAQYGEYYNVYSDIEGSLAWLEFLSGFDLILLPYGDAYCHRISGIIHEARLLNLPVVCHKDIADASLLADTRCLYGNLKNDVAHAVAFCLDSEEGTMFFYQNYPKNIASHLAETSGWVMHEGKPVAVQIKPAWTRCGTSAVLDSQMDYLVDRGYFVIEIYLKTEPWQKNPDQVEFMWQVLRCGREFSGGMVARVFLKDVMLTPLIAYVVKLLRRQIPAFFKRENIHSTWCKPDKVLADFFSRNKAHLVLVNHIFNADFAKKYIPAAHCICETHDIQINQLLRRRSELKDNYDNELQYELDVLQQFDAVVNLNKTEHIVIQGAVGEKGKYIRPAIIERRQNQSYSTLTKLIQKQSAYTDIEKLPEKVDLLIFGDGHPANITSAQFFLDSVFPFLPENTSLLIAGKVGTYLEVDSEMQKNVYIVGYIEKICNVYDFCSIVVLPDITGEGIPIKTDETIAQKVPFVAMEHALRGFTKKDLETAGIEPAKTAEQMADQICELLAQADARNAVSNRMKALMDGNGTGRYFRQWDEVIASMN